MADPILPTPPRQDRSPFGFHFSPVPKKAGGSEVVLTNHTLNTISPRAVTAWVITADAQFSVTVETPIRGVFAAPPGITNPIAANTLAVVKGRWPSIKVATTGAVHVDAYTDLQPVF